MIVYNSKGETLTVERNILSELSEASENGYVDEGIKNSGYGNSIKIGNLETAEIEVFFPTQSGNEFAAIAMMSLEDNIEGYVFYKHHDAIVFLKEFTPMIESILKIRKLVENGK